MMHTPYGDVTPGYWWARYEGGGYIEDWFLAEVTGKPPFLEARKYVPKHLAEYEKYPLNFKEVSFDDNDVEVELYFYNKIEGPPETT